MPDSKKNLCPSDARQGAKLGLILGTIAALLGLGAYLQGNNDSTKTRLITSTSIAISLIALCTFLGYWVGRGGKNKQQAEMQETTPLVPQSDPEAPGPAAIRSPSPSRR